MSNPFTDPAILFKPEVQGNFIHCFDSTGNAWLSFISIERVYARDEQVYVGTSSGDELLVARLPTNDQVEQALMSILHTLSQDEREKDDE